MKLLRLIPVVVALSGAAGGLQAAPDSGGKVVVIFDHPENFTDVKDRDFPSDAGQAGILDSLKRYIVWDAGARLPAGDTLTMTFTDIKLAGQFEPWHGPARQDIRYVRDIYPPAYKFSFAVTDAAGKVLKQGAIDHQDLVFQTRLSIDESDPLHYEKSYLDDAIRDIVHGLK